MAWSGGVFSRVRNWANDKLNSINPQAALFDQEDDNFATGLNNCVTKDGLNKPTATMDWNGQRLTGLAAASASTDAVSLTVGDNRYYRRLSAFKLAPSTRTSTTSMTVDSELFVTIPTIGNFLVDFILHYSGGGAGGGIKFTLNHTGTTTGTSDFGGSFSATALTSSAGVLLGTGIGTSTLVANGGGSFDVAVMRGLVRASSVGDIRIEWAQNASNVTATTLLGGSFLTVIGPI